LITQKPWFRDLGRSDANEIGDAIGGILGPFFSFIGSCLRAYTIYLQIKTREEDKIKDFEKVIFENCLKSLKNAEATIHALNALNPGEKYAINGIFIDYFRKKHTFETIKVHLFMKLMLLRSYLFIQN
jgi:hypothetical protein